MSTAPTAHSAPNPSPCNPLRTSSWIKVWANALRKVAIENQRMVAWSATTRPKRSANAPPAQPPMAPATSVTPPISPASVLLTPNVAISVGMTTAKSWTSKASSAQPPKQAQKVRRSTAEMSLYHLTRLHPRVWMPRLERRPLQPSSAVYPATLFGGCCTRGDPHLLAPDPEH